ncbi:condensation domain-containing protein [Pseudomonas corrugata]
MYDEPRGQWLLALLDHHLVSDNVTLRLIMLEIQAVLAGQADSLPSSQPYRNFIAQAASVSQADHEAYFRRLLADVDSTTAPYGVLDVRGNGAGIKRAVEHLGDELSARVHRTARQQGVPTSVLFHAAWGLVVAATSGRDDGIFGTCCRVAPKAPPVPTMRWGCSSTPCRCASACSSTASATLSMTPTSN